LKFGVDTISRYAKLFLLCILEESRPDEGTGTKVIEKSVELPLIHQLHRFDL
jgi:hypothetical protein